MLVLGCLYLCSVPSWQEKTLGNPENVLEGYKCMNEVDFFGPLGFIDSELGMGQAKQSLVTVEEQPTVEEQSHARDNRQTSDGGRVCGEPCSARLWKWLAAGKHWVVDFAKGSGALCG